MITDFEILEGLQKLGNKEANLKDIKAYRKFMECFNVDADSFNEAQEKIRASLDMTTKMISDLTNDEAKKFLRERFW